MRVQMTFQYLPPGAKVPDELTIADTFYELQAGDAVPNIGDIVTMLVKLPTAGRRPDMRSLKVVARNFFYAHSGETGELARCQIYIIVADPDEDDITDIAE